MRLRELTRMNAENVPPPLTAYIARFVAETNASQIPREVIEAGRGHILDCIGCGLAGSVAKASEIAREYLATTGCPSGPSTVIGTMMRTAPRFAAFANGIAMHADDFDDTAPQPSKDRNGGMHATAPILAACLAIAEKNALSGPALMEALHIGVEVSCKLNHAIATRHHESGYHATSTISVFGVAAAVSRLLGLNAEAVSRAMGIAASQSGGLRENFGTMMNPFHSGRAAESGLMAAELAARGFTASRTILEAPRGFFSAAAGGADFEAIIGRLGNPWAFIDPGMWIKPYPCGALTHPTLTALLRFVHEHDLAPEEIRSIHVQTNSRIANTLIHNRPTSALQAKFSMPFCVAIALVRREATLREFTDDVVNDPAIKNMIEKVQYTPYDKVESDYTNVTTLIDVTLADDRAFTLRADFGKGSPQDPMTFADISQKFRGCAKYAEWSVDQAEEIIDLTSHLEDLDDVRVLTAPTAQSPHRHGHSARGN